MKMKKITIVLIAALMAIALGFLVPAIVKKKQAQQTEAERIAHLRQEQLGQLIPLMSEKQSLQREINELNAALSGNDRKSGMAAILYRGPNQYMQEDALSLMHDYGVKGTILITPQAFPGKEGYMSADELRKLTDAGWDLCVPYMNQSALTKLLDGLNQCGLPAPQSLFIENGVNADIVSYAAEFGISTVIYTDWPYETELEGVFSVHAHSHRENTEAINAAFEPLQSRREYIAITAGFAAEDADVYNTARMDSILDYCAYYGIAIAPVSELAADNRLVLYTEDEAMLSERLKQLSQQLEAVRQQIDEINRKLTQ